MSAGKNNDDYLQQIHELESQLSHLKLELENVRFQSKLEHEKQQFYQLIADFTFDWELWFGPKGEINYCSPSCYDLTGFTANQIIDSSGILELLIYHEDKQKYSDFFSAALSQTLLNQFIEFRILTRTKQLRWCTLSIRGVYDKQGKYMGIRASVHDITRLKKAMGHISELEKGKEFEYRTKQRLQSELELKDRELVSFLLQLSQKNELIAKAINVLNKNKLVNLKQAKATLEELNVLLKSGSVQQLDWEMIESQIEKSHPGFISRLKTMHPFLSKKDQKLCAYIRLGLSSKEISGLINITPQSVEIARVRLRKKLQLSQKARLITYVSQL